MEGITMDYHFLLDLAIILLCTKLFSLFSRQAKLPQVVGALVAGIILGPAIFGIIHETEFIKLLSELGVIVLMFSAGVEVDLKELKKCGKASVVTALFGVLFPLAAGFALAAAFNGGFANMPTNKILENIFIGVIITATSVSITVETLKEMGHLNTKVGTTILSAALIDDVLGVVLLTVITSISDPSVNIGLVLIKIIGFFIFSIAIGIPFYLFFDRYTKSQHERRFFVLIAFVFCLLMSYVAEHFFGVADITGAFIAGVVISNTQHKTFIHRRFDIFSYILISPIFFAHIGISMGKVAFSKELLIFSVLFLLAAILTKVLGCSLGASLTNLKGRDAIKVGVGMVARGEVALIITNKGVSMGVIPDTYYSPVIIMVVFTAIITPVLLKILYSRKNEYIPKCTE